MKGEKDKSNSTDNPDVYPKLSKSVQYWECDLSHKEGPWEWYYYIQALGNKMHYHITETGMSIDYPDGSCIHTNVTPQQLFPDAQWGLTDDQLCRLISLPVEGRHFSPSEVKASYQEYLKAKERGEAN